MYMFKNIIKSLTFYKNVENKAKANIINFSCIGLRIEALESQEALGGEKTYERGRNWKQLRSKRAL